MTSQTCTLHHRQRDPECGDPAARYLLIAYPATARLDDARLRGEYLCRRHATEARVFARAPHARIVVDLTLAE